MTKQLLIESLEKVVNHCNLCNDEGRVYEIVSRDIDGNPIYLSNPCPICSSLRLLLRELRGESDMLPIDSSIQDLGMDDDEWRAREDEYYSVNPPGDY